MESDETIQIEDKFKEYVDAKVCELKTDLLTDLTIDDVFIETILSSQENNELFSMDDFIAIVVNNPVKVCIIGNPGAGKTTFLNYLFAKFHNEYHPITVRLTDYYRWGENNTVDIIKYIEHLSGLDINNLKHTLDFQQVHYILLIDGLDEYRGDIENLISNELNQLLLKKFSIIITSRESHSFYVDKYKKFIVQDINEENIFKYVNKVFQDSNQAENFTTVINRQKELFSLIRNPLFLALLCMIYKNNPNTISNIRSMSNFINETFIMLCDFKKIELEKRQTIKNTLGEIAFNLKINKSEPTPEMLAEDLTKLPFFIPNMDRSNYSFIHKLFEDYFAALYITKEHDFKYFLNSKEEIYNIFDPMWRQTILFWFGTQEVSKEIKKDFIVKLIKLKDGCGGHYSKRAYYLAVEALGQFDDCPNKIATKILKKIANESSEHYKLIDKNVENPKGSWSIPNPSLLDLGFAIQNTNKKILGAIYLKLLKEINDIDIEKTKNGHETLPIAIASLNPIACTPTSSAKTFGEIKNINIKLIIKFFFILLLNPHTTFCIAFRGQKFIHLPHSTHSS